MENKSEKKTIVLLHFAGGNCYSFHFLKKHLPEVDVVIFELPGRGKRMKEPLLYTMGEAVDDLLQQFLAQDIQGDYVIYGHSMGATLALLLTERLEALHYIKNPLQIIATGNYTPVGKIEQETYHLPTPALKKVLKDLGGISEKVLETEEVFAFFEPIIRADLELLEKDEVLLKQAISTPIKVIMGREEEGVEQIENWKNLTLAKYSCEVWPGNHFFIHEQVERLAELLTKAFFNKIKTITL